MVVGNCVDDREDGAGVCDRDREAGIGRRISGVSVSALCERDVS
jgi:hypothetical protein